jgi:hypothetical protein
MIPTKFRFIWLNGFRGEEIFKSANQKQESPVALLVVCILSKLHVCKIERIHIVNLSLFDSAF